MSSSKGLSGIIAGDSSISTVGTGAGLTYRGYSIQDLALKSTYEEVLYLLMYERLPRKDELENFLQTIAKKRDIPLVLKFILENIPGNANCMDLLRTVASILGTLEPETKENNQFDITIRLIAVFGPCLLYWYHYHKSKKTIRLKTNTGEKDSVAVNFIKLLHNDNKTPDPLIVKAIDVSLILYAEHDFNASTFAARVTSSTKSDFYSGIVSAIGTLRGNLHGGANEAAMEFISEIKSIEEVEKVVIIIC